jgi:bacteriocin-like protein
MEETMAFENVPDSIKQRAAACKTPEELLALAKEEGYELTDEELNAINGGILYQDCTWDDCNDVSCKLCKGLCDKYHHK